MVLHLSEFLLVLLSQRYRHISWGTKGLNQLHGARGWRCDESVRICIEFKMLNESVLREVHPISKETAYWPGLLYSETQYQEWFLANTISRATYYLHYSHWNLFNK